MSLVEREATQHDRWVKQSSVADGFEVVRNLLRSEVAEGNRLRLNLIETERCSCGLNVAGDVRRLFFFLVRIDHQRLNHRRVDDSAKQRHHNPERTRHERDSPRTGADAVQEQRSNQQCDQHEQHHCGQLCLEHRIQRALHVAAALGGELVALEPVSPGAEYGQNREQHSEVGLRGTTGLWQRRGDYYAAAQHMSRNGKQQHQQHCEE